MHKPWIGEVVREQAAVREEIRHAHNNGLLQDHWAERNKFENVRKKIQLDDQGKIDDLRKQALDWCRGDEALAKNLLSRALSEHVGGTLPFDDLNKWSRFGGKVESAGESGCPYDFDRLRRTMAELRKVWGYGDEKPIFPSGHLLFACDANDLETIVYYRSFGPHTRNQFMGDAPFNDGDLAHFASTACLYRKIYAHVTALMGCEALDVAELSVIKETHDSGCLTRHYKQARVQNCFVLILGIFDRVKLEWLDRHSNDTRSGIRVYDTLRGDCDDDHLMYPAELILNLVGDACIIRGNAFMTETIPPPRDSTSTSSASFSTPRTESTAAARASARVTRQIPRKFSKANTIYLYNILLPHIT
jgi:hypothetical protein